MVRVEAPPETVAQPPTRGRSFPWLESASIALIASAFLPWERWCTEDPAGLSERCFTAGLWSGSAAFAGVGTALAAVALMVVSLRQARGHPASSRTMLFTTLLATIAVKLVVTAENATIADETNFPASDLGPGFWVGLVLSLGSFVALVASMNFGPRWRGRTLAHLGAAIVVVGLAIPYAWSGLAWWGGPLVHPHELGGGNGVGMRVEPERPYTFQGLIYVHNLSSVPVVLDELALMEPRGQVRVLRTFAATGARPCRADAIDIEARFPPEACAYPLRGYRLEPGGLGDGVMLGFTFTVPESGVYRSGWFRIRYHVGPLRYGVFRTDQLVICAPEPGRKRCPGGFAL